MFSASRRTSTTIRPIPPIQAAFPRICSDYLYAAPTRRKRYSELLTSDPIPPTSRLPFTNDEIKTVWEHQSDPWVDTVLILLYSGWRISEFLNLKPKDIDLKEGTMKCGTKTKAGKNRIVPIHPKTVSYTHLPQRHRTRRSSRMYHQRHRKQWFWCHLPTAQ